MPVPKHYLVIRSTGKCNDFFVVLGRESACNHLVRGGSLDLLYTLRKHDRVRWLIHIVDNESTVVVTSLADADPLADGVSRRIYSVL